MRLLDALRHRRICWPLREQKAAHADGVHAAQHLSQIFHNLERTPLLRRPPGDPKTIEVRDSGQEFTRVCQTNLSHGWQRNLSKHIPKRRECTADGGAVHQWQHALVGRYNIGDL